MSLWYFTEIRLEGPFLVGAEGGDVQVGSITLLAPLTSAPVLRLSLPLHGHCMLAPGAEPFLGSHAVADSLHELWTPPKMLHYTEGFWRACGWAK